MISPGFFGMKFMGRWVKAPYLLIHTLADFFVGLPVSFRLGQVFAKKHTT